MSHLPKRHKSSNWSSSNQPKNLVAAIRFGGVMVKSRHYSRGVGFLNEGDEGIEAKCGAHRPLPPPNGGIQQPQNGICLHESRILDL